MKVLSIISVISSSLNLAYSSYKITCTGDISNHLLQWLNCLLINNNIKLSGTGEWPWLINSPSAKSHSPRVTGECNSRALNTQVEFDFGSGRIIFGRVMPLGLRKIPLIFSFRSLSPLQIDILNWNSVYRCVMRIRRLSLILGPVK